MKCRLRVGAMRNSAHMYVLGHVGAVGQPPCPMGALIGENGPERLGGLCLGTKSVLSCVIFASTGMFPTYPSGPTRVKLAMMDQKQVVAIGFRARWAIYDHALHGVWPQLYGPWPDQHFLILDCTWAHGVYLFSASACVFAFEASMSLSVHVFLQLSLPFL